MQVVTSVGAPSRDEHVGAFAVAIDLTGGKESLVSVRRRRGQRERLGMTGGVALSVTLCLKMNFLFFSDQ